MKIVTWNCNLNFAKKYQHIESMDADICIIQECEKLKVETNCPDEQVVALLSVIAANFAPIVENESK